MSKSKNKQLIQRDVRGRFLSKSEKSEIKGYVGPSISSIFSLLLAQSQGDLVDPYGQNTWVKACVDAISNALSALPIVYNRGEKNSPEEVKNSVLQEVLERPSTQASSSSDLFKWTTLYLDAYGSAAWLMRDREERDQDPEAIQIVNGQNFKPVFNDQHWVIGWKWQRPNGEAIDLGYHEVIMFRYPNPNDPFSGMAPYEAAWDGIISDFKANQFNQAFFDNSGIISGVLKNDNEIDPETLEDFRRKWAQKYSGPENAFKVAALEQGTSFVPTAVTHRDMDYVNLRRYSQDEVLASYNTSRSILGLLEDQNKANAEEARKGFHINVIRPRAVLISGTLWAEWLQYRSERTWIYFDDTGLEFLQADKRAQGLTASTFFRMGYSKRQINDWMQLGFDLTDDATADQQYVPTGVIPIEMSGMARLGEPETKEVGLIAQVTNLLECIKTNGFPKDWSGKPSKLIEVKAVPSQLFDEKKLADELLKLIGPSMTSAAKKSFEYTLDDLGMGVRDFDPQAAAWSKFFNERALEITTIPKRWHKALKGIVSDQIAAGATTTEIALKLTERFKDKSDAWAARIADTEVMNTMNGARFGTMEEEEVPYHGWVSSQDSVVRPSHRINGEIVKVGERFSNGLLHPHDPAAGAGEVVNCRCTTFPSMDPKSISLAELGIKSLKAMEIVRKPLEKQALVATKKWFDLVLDATLRSLRGT